ncbi:MAG: integrase [Gammaproteobacteria bacterium RIFCSPHIGHO2_12_FULL_37_14]|nr:MAG: integrase [Gammaproteobacteria bacterium RIFCSPHIGHO2_12_FULL_37_14]
MSKYPIPSPIIDSLEYVLQNGYAYTKIPSFAPNDFSAVIEFLKQYDGNKATFEAYRREIERLLQWSWFIEKKSILELKRQDIENYIEFCLEPPKNWIGTKRVSRFIERNGIRMANLKWRPFVATISKQDFKKGERPNKNNYQLSQKSIREIFTVLGSFYQYLMIDEKVTINPIALIKQKSKFLQKRQQQPTVMRLTEKQWQFCLQIVKEMATENPEKHERTLFMLSALYLLYLRISELVSNDRWTPMMKHFHQTTDGTWWFKIVGKGNKLREIAVSDDMLLALTRYRKQLRLTPLPSLNEKNYLFPKEKGNGAITDSRHIRRLIQYCFDKTINKLREEKLFSEADSMESATVHWLRHTGISDDINKRGRPISHVRDDAGHSSSAITDRYNDIELKERYKSAKNKKLINTNKENP